MEFDENEKYIENLKKHTIVIPKDATNRDVLKIIFPTLEVIFEGDIWANYMFWGDRYKGTKEKIKVRLKTSLIKERKENKC